jgi:hypothetical protein
MVQLVVGQKGKGKTTEILMRANEEIKTATGNIVFLDRNSAHMYELNNRIRLIDVSRYSIRNSDEFVGFISGIISQDHDLQSVYMDGFLKCAKLEGQSITDTLLRLDSISSMFNITFYISVSVDKEELPEELREKVLVSL